MDFKYFYLPVSDALLAAVSDAWLDFLWAVNIYQKEREAMLESERNNDYIINNRRFLQQPIILTRRVGFLVGFREGCRVGARVVGFWVGWD